MITNFQGTPDIGTYWDHQDHHVLKQEESGPEEIEVLLPYDHQLNLCCMHFNTITREKCTKRFRQPTRWIIVGR